MISQALAVDGSWTLVANIFISGPPGGFEMTIATSLPAPSVTGVRLGGDGTFGSSILASDENVYLRPAGLLAGKAITVTGMRN